MYRTSGVVIVLIGFVLAGLVLFLPYTQALESFEFAEDGGLVRREGQCPSPYDIVWGEGLSSIDEGATSSACESSAQTKVAEAGLIVIAAVLLSLLAFWGGRRPRRQSIDEVARPLPRLDRSSDQP